MGRDIHHISIVKGLIRFNPRAHVGRDKPCRSNTRTSSHVSIHAPTWGATLSSRIREEAIKFQSTRPRGARQMYSANRQLTDIVSIHAPTWGATCLHLSYSSPQELFQSTRPRGARRDDPRTGVPVCVSIHAPTPRAHVGRDRPTVKWWKALSSFNPRAHVGRDILIIKYRQYNYVSIHAPTWGATRKI